MKTDSHIRQALNQAADVLEPTAGAMPAPCGADARRESCSAIEEGYVTNKKDSRGLPLFA